MANRTKETLELQIDSRQARQELGFISRTLDNVRRKSRLAFGMRDERMASGQYASRGAGGRFVAGPKSPWRAGAKVAAGGVSMGMLTGGGTGAFMAPATAAAGYGAGWLNQAGQNVGGVTGGAMRTLGGILGLAGGAAAVGAGLAFQRRKQYGQYLRQFGMARISGLSAGFTKKGAKRQLSVAGGLSMGMSPIEAAGQLAAFGRQRGFAGDIGHGGFGKSPFTGLRYGASMGALGQYAAMAGPGGGGTAMGSEKSGLVALSQAVEQGVRGAGLDRWLQTIASYTGQVAAMGGTVDATSFNRLTSRMQSTPQLAGKGAMQPAWAAQGAGIAKSARQQVLGGLSGISEALMINEASKIAAGMTGGATPENMAAAFDILEGDPNRAFDAMQGDLGKHGFLGRGYSAKTARGLANLKTGGPLTVTGPPSANGNFATSAAFAHFEKRMMRHSKDLPLGKIIEANELVQKAVMSAGITTANLLVSIGDTLKKWFGTNVKAIQDVEKAVNATVGSASKSVRQQQKEDFKRANPGKKAPIAFDVPKVESAGGKLSTKSSAGP